ncbi:hypothetical protein [Pyrobaculum aerophilum]|uniref:hypothetical protein n=1 Tax=Pyrobaculum aerophilum TaxID=13773 RepID=UPI0015F25004|nr:hypothetical protein [Pyrobaculum aerophilum]
MAGGEEGIGEIRPRYENPRADPRFMVYAGDRIFAVWVTVESGPVSKAVVTAVVEYRAV